MSWYKEEIDKEIRKYKFYLPELKSEEDEIRLILRLSQEEWYVDIKIDYKNKFVYVTTTHLNQPIIVSKVLRSLGYKVKLIDRKQVTSVKKG